MADEDPQQRPIARALFGRPRLWAAVVWLVIGAVWLVLGIVEPTVFHFVLAAVWLVLGAGALTVALRDRAARRAP
jgi:hypothetical protein